jgi:hypothetical protein
MPHPRWYATVKERKHAEWERIKADPARLAKKKEANAENFKRHRDFYQAKREIQRLRARKFVWSFKVAHPCSRCDEADPRCLTFHHLGDKKKTLGNIHSTWTNEARIAKEIAKCIILCANCHAKEHVKAPE